MKLFRVLIMLLVLLSCSKKEDKILPTERTLTESVYSSATIKPDSLYDVYAVVSGLLDANLVNEGDLVSKYDHLFQIINNTPKIKSENAELALNLARENLNGTAAILTSIVDEIESTILQYQNDSINYYRQKKLWNQHIGSKAEYDTKKLKYLLASNQLKGLKTKYSRTKTELQNALNQAQNNYRTASIAFNDFTVESKINGKVYALYKEPGEIITTITPLASIGSATEFIIELLVDEVDIVRIHRNQEVLLNLEAYNDVVFRGKVSKIYPQKNERNQTFMVEAVFKEQPKVLYLGLSGEANIIVAKKEKVLTVPKTYVIDANKVKTDHGIVVIKTGLQNMDDIEILSGIGKDTYIYKPK
jgi:multidrug efflux pump subunit AcrA (membrane-fusion protein)